MQGFYDFQLSCCVYHHLGGKEAAKCQALKVGLEKALKFTELKGMPLIVSVSSRKWYHILVWSCQAFIEVHI